MFFDKIKFNTLEFCRISRREVGNQKRNTTMNKTKLRKIASETLVSEYTDYKSYLTALYLEAKHNDDSYSYARFSNDLGLGSSNAHCIVKGRRKLTLKAGQKIAEHLKLTSIQKKYLLALIKEENAKTDKEKEDAFEERLQIKKEILPNDMSRQKLSFFEKWYHAAILELLRLDGAKDDPEWISLQLKPEVKQELVSESLDLLEKLGYIEFSEEKQRRYPSKVTISSGNDVKDIALKAFHRQMLKLSNHAIDGFRQSERDISALSITATPEVYQKMKEEIIAMRKRILELSEQAKDEGAVYQLNFQLFPLTASPKEEDHG